MKRHLLPVVVVVAIASSLTVPHAKSAAQSARMPLAFTHVTVIDTEHALTRGDQTVLVSGDRISDVGLSKAVSVPEAAQVVEATGKFLMPGLWDMHVHTFAHLRNDRSTRAWFFPLFIANGVTGVRDMWTTGEEFQQVVTFRKGLADGSLLVPRYGAVGWLVDGPGQPGQAPPSRKNRMQPDIVSTPQEARDFVLRARASGVDFIKVYDDLPRDVYFALAGESKKAGIPFAGHVALVITAAEASDAGQRSMEHLLGADIGCSAKEAELSQAIQAHTAGALGPRLLETYDERTCEQLLRRLSRNQNWQVPTLVVHEPENISDGRSKYLPASARARWQGVPPREPGRSPFQRYRLRLVGLMNKVGTPLMTGTDMLNPFVYPGFSEHDELALFVEAGLTPGEALKTATYNPAKFLGMLDRLGTVEKGKLADLVLLDANPLEDIHNTQKIRAVVLNGRYLDRSALDKLLADAAAVASAR
jgi:imidazolonepropionase-like amidohydrolase